MKKHKSKIIEQTILFIFIIVFVIAFKSAFGDKNTLIGVTTITATLMFLQKDLTLSPFKNTLGLIALNLFIGISATLCTMNIWASIPINFIAIFIIAYLLTSNLRAPMAVAFTLQYVFILATPVPINELPIRLISLVAGALFIMVVQLLFNRTNITKNGNKLLINTCNEILKKLNYIDKNKDISSVDKSIYSNLSIFRSMIYDKREDHFYLTKESKIKLNISVALEKISLLLNETNLNECPKLKAVLEYSLTEIPKFLTDEKLIIDKNVISKIKEYKGNTKFDINSLKIINNIAFIYESFNSLKELGMKNYNITEKLDDIPKNFKLINSFENNYKSRSAKFCYAIRLGFGISLAFFIVEFFHFQEGRWLYFTVLSLVSPIYEAAKDKTKARIFATIIGVISVGVLFSIFATVTIRTILLLLAGYIAGYIKPYKYNFIFVTFSAVGAAGLLSNTGDMILNRLFFVICGAILAISINKFILPYNLKNDTTNLKKMYLSIINEMLSILNDFKNPHSKSKMDNLFIVTSFVENRFKENNIANDEDLTQLSSNNRLLICSIYELFIQLSNCICEKDDLQQSLNKLKYSDSNEIYEKKLENYINSSTSLEEKLLISNIVEINNRLIKLKKIIQ